MSETIESVGNMFDKWSARFGREEIKLNHGKDNNNYGP